MLRNSPDERGFALIELLVTVVVLGIVLTAVAAATVSSTDRTLKTDARVGISAALEEANETLQAQRPWITNRGCLEKACSLPVKRTDGADYYTTYVTSALPNQSGYRVLVTVLAVRSGGSPTSPADEIFPAVSTVFTIENGAKSRVGSVIVRACTVSQVDERMPAGSCAGNGAKLMEAPEVKMPKDDPDTPEDERVLTPPDRHYLTNPKIYQWFLAACHDQPACGSTTDAHAETAMVRSTRVDFSARLVGPKPSTAVARPATDSKGGELRFDKLEPGDYTLVLDAPAPSGYMVWKRKSVGNTTNLDSAQTTYSVSVMSGASTLVTKLWQPRPVDVKMHVRTFDGTVPWDPYWIKGGADLRQQEHMRMALMPFPEGRAVIPGADGRVYDGREGGNCERSANDVLMLRHDKTVCVEDWATVRDGQDDPSVPGDDRLVFHNVRPGLYSSNVYRSYKVSGDGWHLKKRPIAKWGLGLDGDDRWQGPSQNSRISYLFVRRDGTVDTGGSGTPSVMLPSCEADLRVLLRQFATLGDLRGTGWRYHGEKHQGDANGSWTSPSYGLDIITPHEDSTIEQRLNRMVNRKGRRAAFGWVKYVGPSWRWVYPPGGDRYKEYGDEYLAAKGGWNSVEDTDVNDWQRKPTQIYFKEGTRRFFVPDACDAPEVDIPMGPDGGA